MEMTWKGKFWWVCAVFTAFFALKSADTLMTVAWVFIAAGFIVRAIYGKAETKALAKKHWKHILLGVCLWKLFASLGGTPIIWRDTVIWAVATFSLTVHIFNKGATVRTFLGEQAAELLKLCVKILKGDKGADLALVLWGGILFTVGRYQYDAGIAVIGILLIIASICVFLKKHA